MGFFGQVCAAFLLASFVDVAATDHHSNINRAFRSQHSIEDDRLPCHRSIGISTSSDPVPTVTITHLNVSTTVYVSMEDVEVTWTLISNRCPDDFIGIYFVEVPILTGIYAIS
jgi:hypothetical protein